MAKLVYYASKKLNYYSNKIVKKAGEIIIKIMIIMDTFG